MKSDKLEEIICNGGTPVADCEFCNRVHFAGSEGYFDEGEYDKLIASAKKNPKKYVEHGADDAVSIGRFAGKTWVWGCDCKGLDRYEQFIWENRRVILEFIKRRSQAIRDIAQTTEQQLTDIEKLTD